MQAEHGGCGEIEQRVLETAAAERVDQPVHLAEARRLADQEHLELPVVHIDERTVVVQHAADRHRVAERAEYVLAAVSLPVRLHGHRARLERRNVLDALEHVSEVAEQAFHAARRRVGALRERTERRDVGQIAVVEAPGVDLHVAPRRQHAAHIADAAGQAQCAREVVRRARGNVGDGQPHAGAEHAVDHGVQRAVAADADNPPAAGLRGGRGIARAVFLRRRLAADDRHAGALQTRFQQVGVQKPFRAPRTGVDDHQNAAIPLKNRILALHTHAVPFPPDAAHDVLHRHGRHLLFLHKLPVLL